MQKNGLTFKLDKTEGSHEMGEMVEGFGYQNQKQEFRFTTNLPKSRKGHYAFGEVTDTRRDLGVFVNIGLPDKDVAVSLDELPTMRELWPKKGDQLMISLKVDEKDRLWGAQTQRSLENFQIGKDQMPLDEPVWGTPFLYHPNSPGSI